MKRIETSFLRRDRPTGATRVGFWATLTSFVAMVLAVGIAAQSPPAKPAAAAPKPALAATPKAAGCVDNVIELVKAKMSDARIISSLKNEGKACKLSTADLLKLQKAGVGDHIIEAMENPGAAGGAPTSPAAPTARNASSSTAEVGGAATPFPPDLADVPAVRRRRLTVDPFDYSTVMNWVHYWFNTNQNIGEGIRAMLTVRMAQSKSITLLERAKLAVVMKEQDFGGSNRVKKGTNARIGQITGADVML
jgi:curli biogenesis system outer membrane secretion channel CsgG